MDVSQGLWAALIVGILGLIVLDFVTVSRKPHDVMFIEAALGQFSTSVLQSHSAFGYGLAMVPRLAPSILRLT